MKITIGIDIAPIKRCTNISTKNSQLKQKISETNVILRKCAHYLAIMEIVTQHFVLHVATTNVPGGNNIQLFPFM